MIRSVTSPQVGATGNTSNAGAAGQTREKTTAEKLLGEAGVNYDPKLREKLMLDLNKFPSAALDKLLDDGWTVRVVNNKPNSDGVVQGGCCRTNKKVIEVDGKSYAADTDGKLLLHETAHALDFKGNEAPGLLRKMMGVHGKAMMGTDTNSTMAGIFQKFQTQNAISLASAALKEKQQTEPGATSTGFATPFNPKMQVNLMDGKMVVAYDKTQCADQSRSLGVKTALGETPATLDLNGVEVKNVSQGKHNFTLVSADKADQISTDWTSSGSYVAASNLPSELFAEGVAAYLASPESRDKLMAQSPDLHAFVQSSMNEFLIADHR